MNKFVSGIALLLMPLLSIANDEVVAVAPQVDADPTGLIVFAVVLVGMIGGYALVIWRNESKKKDAIK